MINKLISSRRVIAKVFADLDLKEDPMRVSDVREWIGEAMEKIGSVNQTIKKESVLEVRGYQASMPMDLDKLNQVAYSRTGNENSWHPIKSETSNFDFSNNYDVYGPNAAIYGDSHMVTGRELIELTKFLYGKYPDDPMYDRFSRLSYQEAIGLLNSDENIKTVLTNLLYKYKNGATSRFYDIVSYRIKPGYITLSVPSGYVRISYNAILTDDRGYPLIPDMQSYIEAIYWYIVMKLKYPEYLGGRMHREIYHDIRRSWNFYSRQAYAESMMPAQDDMENIRSIWNRLIPLTDEGAESFMGSIADKENIYNQTN